MDLLLPDSVSAFLEEAQHFLEQAEARHSLILGAALSLREREPPADSPWFLAVVRESGVTALAALMTPPYPLILASNPGASEEEPERVVEVLARDGWPVSGVLADPEVAGRFAKHWERVTGRGVQETVRQRIYALESPIGLDLPGGWLRPATEEDSDTVVAWMKAFQTTRKAEDGERVAHEARGRIAAGQIYLWDDSGPRCMAASSRPTRRTVTINAVYTPSEWRGRGYATAAVSTLSRRLLAEGFEACVLYADMASPGANAIYRRIGYHPVGEAAHLVFGEPRDLEHQSKPRESTPGR